MNPAEYRNEQKYVCTQAQLLIIENNIREICRPDPHANGASSYVIRSAYLDDLWDGCFGDNEVGSEPRAKYRLRTYNGSTDFIALERKSKSHGMTKKEMRRVDRDVMAQILDGSFRYGGDDDFLMKFYMEYGMRHLRPKVVVEYVRTPYVYPDGNVRITFDRNICAASNMREFWREDAAKRMVLPKGYHVLEVKFDRFLPDFLKNLLQAGQLTQTSFSKYYICRQKERVGKLWTT